MSRKSSSQTVVLNLSPSSTSGKARTLVRRKEEKRTTFPYQFIKFMQDVNMKLFLELIGQKQHLKKKDESVH
jgi:hypothetical protein